MALPGNEKRIGLTPTQWQRAEALFHEALDVPTAERDSWLANRCEDDPAVRAEVLSLLGSDDAAGTGFVEKQLAPARAQFLDPAPVTRAGPYRLIRELGQGGMGTVYLAERDDEQYTSQVAIKLVRPGLDTDLILNRFYRERQTLARLQHPNIARLLDGGTTPAGMPYIVMEFIDGQRITDYCCNRDLNIDERLTMFLGVCKAVEYAHHQFVVHRDLKPGNILVDASGTVKLLDFGICKLLHSTNQFNDVTLEASPPPLTPDYASPEQILGEPITVASDVYSAAAVLYELLTGVKPHKIESYTIRGIERGICQTEITRPSEAANELSTRRQLRGDLDTILMHALRKDAARRYESMEAFSADIARYLAHEPVLARPDSFAYRTGKFLRRRRGWVAAAAAVMLTMTAGVASSRREARIANENLRMVRQLSNQLIFDVYESVQQLPGSTNARELILKTGTGYLDNLSRDASDDLELQLELSAAYRRIGDVQGNARASNLGNTSAALQSYERALQLMERVRKANPGDRLAGMEHMTLLTRMGGIRTYMGDIPRTLEDYEKSRAIGEMLLLRYPGDPDVTRALADTSNFISEVLRRRGDFDAARKASAKAIELLEPEREKRSGDRLWQQSLSQGYAGAGQSEVRFGRLKEALALYQKAAALVEELLRQEPERTAFRRDLMIKYSYIGDLLGNPNLRNLGDVAGAAQAYGKMVALAKRIHEADPADQRARSDFGIALARTGAIIPAQRGREKIAVLQRSLQLLDEANQLDAKNTLNRIEHVAVQSVLGTAYLESGDNTKATQTYREGLRAAEPLLKSGSGTALAAFASMSRNLGELAARRGDRKESLGVGRRIVEAAASSSGNASPEWRAGFTARAAAAMGYIYLALASGPGRRPGDKEQAREWLEKARAAYQNMGTTRQFSEAHRREMLTVEKLLEKLK